MNSFKCQAEEYEKSSNLQKENGIELLRILAPQKGIKALDLGCGIGFHSKILSALVGSDGLIIAIDPDAQRLAYARENYSATNLHYLDGSVNSIPGNDYDLVFSSCVLHWIEDKDSVFKHVSRCLKSGGRFGFVCSTHSEMIDIVTEVTHSRDFVKAVKRDMHYTSADNLQKQWLYCCRVERGK